MSNFISFSLFGANPVYCVGALRNVELAAKIYPKWTCVFYVDKDVPKRTIQMLAELGAEVRDPVPKIANQMFWRFCIADDPKVERFIVRDCDSRLSKREMLAVNEWIASGKKFHSMRDHPAHTLPLGGGLWGAVKGACPPMTRSIIQSKLATKSYTRQTAYGADQTFLSNYIWPIAEKSWIQHDSCCRKIYRDARPFPSGCRFNDPRFIGEIMDENEKPNPIHWQMRINWQAP